MYDYIDRNFPKYQGGFRKRHNPQHIREAPYMIENIKQARDAFSPVLTGLSKGLSCNN